MTDEAKKKSLMEVVGEWASLFGALAALPILLIGGFFALAWAAQGSTKHLICKGTAADIYGERKLIYPHSQLGVKFTDTNWLGRTLFDAEARYEFSLIALDEVEGGTPVRESGVNLTFFQLTDDIISGSETDEIWGETVLFFDSTNAFIGLSRRKDTDGFDFDGFCNESGGFRFEA